MDIPSEISDPLASALQMAGPYPGDAAIAVNAPFPTQGQASKPSPITTTNNPIQFTTSNPSWQSETPVTPGGTGQIGTGFTSDYTDPSVFGAADLPSISGLTGGTIAGGTGSTMAGSGFFSQVFAILGNFFVRGGLVIVAIILIALALWAMLGHSQAAQAVRSKVKAAV